MDKDLDLAILKTIISNRKYALEFVQCGSEKIFSSEHFFFSKCIIDYIRIYKDLPTKRIILEKFGKSEKDQRYITINSTWEKLENFSYDEKEYKYDLEKLKNRFAFSKIENLKEKISNQSSIEKILSDIHLETQHIKNIFEAKKTDQKSLKDAIDDFKSKYRAKLDDSTVDQGILTGYSYLDHLLNGIKKQEFFLWGGETNSGKSMCLLNQAIQMWMQKNTVENPSNSQGYNIVYFSLEMPFDECFERTLARLAMVPQKKIRDAKLNEEEIHKLQNVMNFIKHYPFHFEIVDIPRGATIESIEAICNDLKATKFTPDVIIIDYMTLMDLSAHSSDGDNDALKLEKLSGLLHEFARACDYAVISAVQLTNLKRNNAHKSQDMQFGGHRIARSGGILNNVNFFCQLIVRQNEKDYPDLQWTLVKSRRSENLVPGSFIKNLECCALLDNISTNFEEQSTEDISEKVKSILGF